MITKLYLAANSVLGSPLGHLQLVAENESGTTLISLRTRSLVLTPDTKSSYIGQFLVVQLKSAMEAQSMAAGLGGKG